VVLLLLLGPQPLQVLAELPVLQPVAAVLPQQGLEGGLLLRPRLQRLGRQHVGKRAVLQRGPRQRLQRRGGSSGGRVPRVGRQRPQRAGRRAQRERVERRAQVAMPLRLQRLVEGLPLPARLCRLLPSAVTVLRLLPLVLLALPPPRI
jgi:hypothetical protein